MAVIDFSAIVRDAVITLKGELQTTRAQQRAARAALQKTRARAAKLYAGSRRKATPQWGGLEDDAKAEAARLLERLESGDLSADQWEAEMQAMLAAYHQAAYMLGQRAEALDADAADELALAVAGQYAYLAGFRGVIAEALAAGEGAWKAWSNRAAMYAEAIGASFWRAFTGGWPLPAYPRDGTTQCLSHCNCQWDMDVLDQEKGDADAYWKLGPVEHCQTCIERAAQWSPLKVRGGVLQE